MKGVFASAVAVALLASTASAQGQGEPSPLQAQEGEQTQPDFQIPAQPLSGALNAFGRQSGFQVTIDSAIAAGVQSPGVSGTMTPAEALSRLLAGTGIVGRFSGNRTVVLTRSSGGAIPGAIQLDPVQVQGYPVPSQAMIDNLPPPYAGGQVATGGQLGLLGNRDVMDTPFNQTNYTSKKAQDQQAKTVREVLIDDPSVRAGVRDGSGGADTLYVRGFNTLPETATYGGLNGMLPTQSIMAEIAERIELLRGPTAMLNGMPNAGAVGGTINVVPKRAPDEPLTRLTANYVSSGQVGGAADMARRFGNDKQFGARFNGVFRAGNTATEWNTDKRALSLLGLDFRGETVRLSADLGYQYQYIGGLLPGIGLAAGVQTPWAPIASKNYGQPWAFKDVKDAFAVFRAEVDMTEQVTAYAAFGMHDYRAEALYGGFSVTALNANGNGTTTPSLQSIYNTNLTAEAGLRGRAQTGPIDHEFGVNASWLQVNIGAATVNGTPIVTNIYNPTLVARPSLPTPAANKTTTVELSSFGIADTLTAADKRIQLTVGARLQQVTTADFNATTGVRTGNYSQSAVSPAVALIFKPWDNVSIYGNYIQGLEQGLVVGAGFANAGQAFPPFTATQYEAGVKVDWGKFTSTLSLFQITRPSTILDVPTNTLQLAGEQRNRGLEINLFGEPAPGVRLLGGAMLLDAVLTKTQGGLTNGWVAPGTPNAQFNVSGEWDLPFVPGLTATGRVIYTGRQYVGVGFPRPVLADWTRFDLGARYTFDNVQSPTGKPVVIRFAVDNVLDTNYWQSVIGSLNLGAPRTFRLSTSFDF